MTRIAYVNGRYAPHAEAMVHIEDRGYQFSDGVYEFIAFFNRRLLDGALHLDRLERSLAELRIAMPMSRRALEQVVAETIAQNPREHGNIYMQITRGVVKRDHPFPKTPIKPALVLTVAGPKSPKPSDVAAVVKIVTAPDLRWARRDIKSISLLGNVLARQASAEVGARETWLYDAAGVVCEGSASNGYIVDARGHVITHPANSVILGGITRDVVLRLARAHGIPVEERPFTLEEMRHAKEAFMTSTSANVLPITEIDGVPVANGHPGLVTQKLLELYVEHVFAETGYRCGY